MADRNAIDFDTPGRPSGDQNSNLSESTDLLAMATRHHPGDMQRLLSILSAAGTGPDTSPGSAPLPSTQRINVARTYLVARSASALKPTGALIDRGANRGLAGSDCRVIEKLPDQFVNIEGIDKHRLPQVPIVTCGVYTVSHNHGPVIIVFHQFTGMLRGPTIISSTQLEAHHNLVNERSRGVDPHGQQMTTNDGYEFPLHVRHGLAYLDMRPYTDHEWETLPHVIMTSDTDWDPASLDGEFPLSGQESYLDGSTYDNGTPFDVQGNYKKGTLVASACCVHDDHPALSTQTNNNILRQGSTLNDTEPIVVNDDKHQHLLPPPGPPPVLDSLSSIVRVRKVQIVD